MRQALFTLTRFLPSQSGSIVHYDNPDAAVHLFERLARDTWERLEAGLAFDIAQSEETITDINLLEMARARLPRLRLYKATRAEESEKGFDWEWWIGSRHRGWWRYAIQAKRLDATSGDYRALRHRVGSRFQIEILEDFAHCQGAVPLYCFYNYVDSATAAAGWQCNLSTEYAQLGCTLVPLETVKRAHKPRRSRRFADLHCHRRSLPWRCLFRCPYFTSSALDRAGHPMANDGMQPRKFAEVPPMLQREEDDMIGVNERTDLEYYTSELGGYPRRIMVVELGPE